MTNNKRRHSLILALHAAGDGSGYGDLGKVYSAVKFMHDGLAAGSGWTSEAGECCRIERMENCQQQQLDALHTACKACMHACSDPVRAVCDGHTPELTQIIAVALLVSCIGCCCMSCYGWFV